jgi:hypothetical protein
VEARPLRTSPAERAEERREQEEAERRRDPGVAEVVGADVDQPEPAGEERERAEPDEDNGDARDAEERGDLARKLSSACPLEAGGRGSHPRGEEDDAEEVHEQGELVLGHAARLSRDRGAARRSPA